MDNSASPPKPHNPHYIPQQFYSHNQAWLLNSQTFSQDQPRNNNSLNFNLNHLDDTINNDEDTDINSTTEPSNNDPLIASLVDKEPMFEKPLTPSDVGKLNRLVIPKQYAEKYFPLASGDSGEKGLLLSFEDESGKFWRFRYSYWNSSQSYVLTKGWSRYVKEKRLDAGDVVLFQRHRSNSDRFFISWRRRVNPAQDSGAGGSMAQVSGGENCCGGGGGNRGGWMGRFYSAHDTYPTHHQHQHLAVPYPPDCLHAGSSMGENQVSSVGNSRILRLFGVNMECQADNDHEECSEPYGPDGSSLLSQGSDPQHLYPPPAYYSNHMILRPSLTSSVTYRRDGVVKGAKGLAVDRVEEEMKGMGSGAQIWKF